MAFPCSPSVQLQSILHLTSWHLSSAWMCCDTCTLAGKLTGRGQAHRQVTVCLLLAGNKSGLMWSNSLLFADQVKPSRTDVSHQLRYCTPKLQSYHMTSWCDDAVDIWFGLWPLRKDNRTRSRKCLRHQAAKEEPTALKWTSELPILLMQSSSCL